ncbi:glutathione S-transferase family protein [Thalassotalea sp. PS06]|uniref:glutathione S-transferase family protein n=1 Tax=Thalassotalea sp. PS06 TaxID=2594005 RepID=UPI0011625A4A|nr:glutathione S-transferase family protein [Thalassotalea sp. PS06]QDP01597.1 glutathione S-transferase family protein [Thalassotalea sp. PS06]
MGLLVDGQWHDQWYDTKATGGKFERKESSFRSWITADGEAGPNGEKGFKAEANRYHLYVSLACPWAHRTLIFRKLKGLEEMISVSVVHYLMKENGWTFAPQEDKDNPDWVSANDDLFENSFLHQVYTQADSNYTGRVTVPVLWDKKTNTIVSNESSEIIRMLNSSFDHLGAKPWDFYPESLREEIDTINDFVYPNINNGVYRAGFATTQQAYEEAVVELFSALDSLEKRLAKQRYLVGDSITEADWRLFTTLVRFDAVYVGHFKCNLHRIADYPNISGYLRELYQVPGVAETVNMTHIKHHYYESHDMINPTGVVPKGPILDFTSPHNRG